MPYSFNLEPAEPVGTDTGDDLLPGSFNLGSASLKAILYVPPYGKTNCRFVKIPPVPASLVCPACAKSHPVHLDTRLACQIPRFAASPLRRANPPLDRPATQH